mmetsp:Transcript_81852/g.128914  ORF Transcript_81852/g.128914 Transcript_81852/m.128914 type:complete len:495 (+) Transcript_81852:112-1596(+)
MAQIASNPRGVSVSCQCACSEQLDSISNAMPNSATVALGAESALGYPPKDDGSLQVIDLEAAGPRRLRPRPERGILAYIAELHRPLIGPPLRSGEVWHLHHEEAKSLEPAILTLYANGYEVRPDKSSEDILTVSWSPFSLVQACRLHSVQADAALPWLRLFKISVFHHGTAHFFAARGEDESGSMRARWVADVARAMRSLTESLFPLYRIRADPVSGAAWTSTRLLAGYMLMCDNQDVALVYCELHTHWDFSAAFAVYEDECCETRVMHVNMGVHTCISERVGIDCSCFSIDGHHFSARSSAEKAFWLRAISNVKVKLRHRADNPSPQELSHYRSSVSESARALRNPSVSGLPAKPVLQRREKEKPAGSRAGSDEEDSWHKGPAATKLASAGGPGQMWGVSALKAPQTPSLLPREMSTMGPPQPPPTEEPPPCNAPSTVKPVSVRTKSSSPSGNGGLCGQGRSLGNSPRLPSGQVETSAKTDGNNAATPQDFGN